MKIFEQKDTTKLVQVFGDGVRLSIRGMGHAPSFKTQKGAAINRETRKPFPVTPKKIREWMRRVTESFGSQLLYATQMAALETWTGGHPRSWIVSSLPLDDSRHWIVELVIKDAQVEPGQEGADILIERLTAPAHGKTLCEVSASEKPPPA